MLHILFQYKFLEYPMDLKMQKILKNTEKTNSPQCHWWFLFFLSHVGKMYNEVILSPQKAKGRSPFQCAVA